jgi:iron complex transport system ATP-binding protein
MPTLLPPVTLVAENLRVDLPGRTLFDGLDFKASPGQVLAILGRNGAGKSTLLKILAGWVAPTAGHVRLNQENLAVLPASERAKWMAVVTTERPEMVSFSVAEVIALGRLPYLGLTAKLKTDDREAITRAMSLLEVSSFADRRFSTLSDGERQRVMIARALAQATPLLLFDEPTASFDAIARRQFFGDLKAWAAEMQLTLVLTTHELDLARGFADYLLLLGTEGRWAFGPAQQWEVAEIEAILKGDQ